MSSLLFLLDKCQPGIYYLREHSVVSIFHVFTDRLIKDSLVKIQLYQVGFNIMEFINWESWVRLY